MRTSLKTVAMALIISMTAAITAHADLYFYEGFQYANGEILNGKAGGEGWSGSRWTRINEGVDLIVVSEATTKAANISHNGNQIQKAGGGPGTATLYSRDFPALTFSDGDTLWFSFSLHQQFDSGFQNGIRLFDGGNEVLLIGNDPTKTTPDRNEISVVEDTGARFQQSDVAISGSTNQASYFLGRIDFQPGDELLSLYYGSFVPSGTGGLGTNMPDAFENLPIDNIASLSSLQIDINNSAQGFVDEIRFADNFNDVRFAIPEPGSLALLGLGACALLARSKRCH